MSGVGRELTEIEELLGCMKVDRDDVSDAKNKNREEEQRREKEK